MVIVAFGVSSPPLPNPPDRSDPANTVNGPLGGNPQSYGGGVLVRPEAAVNIAVATNEPVATFECAAGTKTITKTLPITVGESLSGPLSDSQTTGIIDAINAVKPKAKSVTLSATVSGDPTKIITYTLTAVTYSRQTYDVYVITQAVPAIEQLAGYIVVDTPKSLQINSTATPCVNAGQPMIILGDGWKLNSTGKSTIQSFFDIFILPDDGLPPFFQYGKVYIYSGGSIYGGTDVRPGETVSFEVPPGTYTVSGDLGIFGLHISIPGQTVSPPAGENIIAMIISITLAVEEIVYVIIVILIIAIILIAVFIVRHFVGGGGSQPEEGGGQPSQPEAPREGSGEEVPEESVD